MEEDYDGNIFIQVGGGTRTKLKTEDVESIASWFAHKSKGRTNAALRLAGAMADKAWAEVQETDALVTLYPGLFKWKEGIKESLPTCLGCENPESQKPGASTFNHTCGKKVVTS